MRPKLNSAKLPDLHALHVATVVIEAGGMRAAASRLGVTQSAVSQAVKRAETQLGAALLHRKTQPLQPTEAGHLLLRHMTEIRHRLDQAIEDLRLLSGQAERRVLRLGMVDSFASTVGPHLIRHLMTSAVAARVTVHSGLSEALVEELAQHRIDLAITSEIGPRQQGLSGQVIYREPFVLVAPQGLSPRLQGLSLREILKIQPLIRYGAPSHLGRLIEEHLGRLDLAPPAHLSFETTDALMAMVAGGVGVVLSTPLCLLQTAAHLPKLTVLPLPAPGFTRNLMVVTRAGSEMQIADQIAMASREILSGQILPQLSAELPWLDRGPHGVVPQAGGLFSAKKSA